MYSFQKNKVCELVSSVFCSSLCLFRRNSNMYTSSVDNHNNFALLSCEKRQLFLCQNVTLLFWRKFMAIRSSPGFVNRTQSHPGFVNPVRSGAGFVNPIRSDPVLVFLTPAIYKSHICNLNRTFAIYKSHFAIYKSRLRFINHTFAI